jgi:hypothetical protein
MDLEIERETGVDLSLLLEKASNFFLLSSYPEIIQTVTLLRLTKEARRAPAMLSKGTRSYLI